MIAYAAHTDTCTFYLDEDGICRRVVRHRGQVAREADPAQRCVGAQYVASLDPTARGMLAAMPRLGVPLIFAYVGENGRIALVRTGAIAKFEPATEADASDSGVRALPDAVEEPSDDETETQTLPLSHHHEEVSRGDGEDDCDDGAETAYFRTSHPPPPPMGMAYTPSGGVSKWAPPTRVERVSMIAPPPRIPVREVDPSAPTIEHPVAPRGRGMLPARALRGGG
jgi:hypothetical protein